MEKRIIKSGRMPSTDFRYEEFEGLLASFYLTLLCLKGRPGEDGKAFQKAVRILNGFARRHNVRLPREAAKNPRPKVEEWARPQAFTCCFSLLDMMSSFYRDFYVGADPEKQRKCFLERCRLGQCILDVLHRHDVITAKFQDYRGKKIPVGVSTQKSKIRKSLGSVLDNEKIAS